MNVFKTSLSRIALVVLALSSNQALAAQDNDFQHEVGVDTNRNSENLSDGLNGIAYRYAFSKVNQDSSPYRLNQFLHQGSYVGGFISDYSDLLTSYNLDGRYVFDTSFYVGASYTKQQFDSKFSKYSADTDIQSLSAGYYLNDVTELNVTYSHSDLRHGAKLETITLSADTFYALESTSGIYLSAAYLTSTLEEDGHSETHSNFGLVADWYINKSWYVGADLSEGAGNYLSNVSTGYVWRVMDNLSITGEAGKYIDSDIDGVQLSLGLLGRF